MRSITVRCIKRPRCRQGRHPVDLLPTNLLRFPSQGNLLLQPLHLHEQHHLLPFLLRRLPPCGMLVYLVSPFLFIVVVVLILVHAGGLSPRQQAAVLLQLDDWRSDVGKAFVLFFSCLLGRSRVVE